MDCNLRWIFQTYEPIVNNSSFCKESMILILYTTPIALKSCTMQVIWVECLNQCQCIKLGILNPNFVTSYLCLRVLIPSLHPMPPDNIFFDTSYIYRFNATCKCCWRFANERDPPCRLVISIKFGEEDGGWNTSNIRGGYALVYGKT